ncbi:hypothetical protein NKG05_12150 [Oerskovia sp. M15]
MVLDVHELEPADALRLLRTGDLDIVLLELDIQEKEPANALRGMREVALLDEPWRLVVPATFPTPARLDDVRDAVWLGPEPTTAAARALGRLADPRHHVPHASLVLRLRRRARARRGRAGRGDAPGARGPGETPDGVTVVPLPGLGSRRLVARHRATRHEPRPVVNAVIDEMIAAAAAIELG